MADKEIARFASELGGSVIVLADTVTGLVTGFVTPAGTVYISGVAAGAIPRSAAQLAAAPSPADIALGAQGQFFDPLQTVDATHPWVYYSATATAYVRIAGTGGSGAATGTATPQALGTATAGTATAASHEDHVHAMPTARQVGAMPIASGTYNGATGHAFDVHGVDLGVLTAGVAPPTDAAFTVIGCPTSTASSLGSTNFTTLINGDVIYFDSVNYTKSGVNTIGRQTAAIQKGDNNAGASGSGLIDAAPGTDYMPGTLMLCNVPVCRPPDGVIGANGALTLGTSVGGGNLTFGATAAGSTTCTASVAAFAATDVNRGIVVGGQTCTITAFTSTTQVTLTIPTGGLSSATWAAGTWNLGTYIRNMPGGVYSYGLWMYFPANVIDGSNVAGYRWVVMSNVLTGQIFQNNYIPGHNAVGDANSWHVPAAPTAYSGTTGSAFAAGTAALTAHSVTVPANSMGPNGELTTTLSHWNNNSAGTKSIAQTFGGAVTGYAVNATTSQGNYDSSVIWNKGTTNRQEAFGQGPPFHSGLSGHGTAVDTTAAQTLVTTILNTVATDWNMIEAHKVTLVPGL